MSRRLHLANMACLVVAVSAYGQTSLPFYVVEDAGVARAGTCICNGIPVAREWNWTDPAQLELRDAVGQPVPAQWEVLSRWAGGVLSTQPIQWLLVTFPASPAAGETLTYHAVPGAGLATATGVQASVSATSIVVNTGAALFRVPKDAFGLFGSAALSDGIGGWRSPVVTAPGGGVIRVAGFTSMTAGPPETVALEHEGALRVVVKTEGHFSPTAGAAGRFRYLLRYHFFAGSPSVDVDLHFDCPTDISGGMGYDAWSTNDYFRLTRVSLALPIQSNGAAGAFLGAEPGVFRQGAAPGSLVQHLRPAMTSAPSYSLTLDGQVANGLRATHPAAALTNALGGIMAGFQQMHLHEPQALNVDSAGLEMLVVATNQWLGPRQGAFARMRFRFLSPGADPAALHSAFAADMDHPLVAWPGQADVARSRALGELWDGRVSARGETCLARLRAACSNTMAYVAGHGMHGFMTHGLGPRHFGDPILGDEFGDVTTWDGYYHGGSFTDYHNVFYNAARAFALTGDRRFLHEICLPAARRMLSTQIIQGEPIGDFRTGWASTGYGGYRRDPNSSHSYFDNLFLYYWFTGDRHVLDLLGQGAAVRRLTYNRNPDMTLVPPEDPPLADWEDTAGRMGSQRAAINWFLGHVLEESYLADFRNQMERIAARHLTLIRNKAGEECAVLFEESVRDNPGTEVVQQPWLAALYSMENLWRLYADYGDVALGPEAIPISRIFKGYERYLWSIVARIAPGADGTAAAPWANHFSLTWSGPRIGGVYVTSNWTYVDSDSLHYVEGKAAHAAPLFRAAAMNNLNAETLLRAGSLADYCFSNPPTATCLDKVNGPYFSGLIPAAAYGSPEIRGTVTYDGFQTGAWTVVAAPAAGSWDTARAADVYDGFRFDRLPFVSNYWLKAFVDEDGNGLPADWEAQGLYAGNPLSLTGTITGVNMDLADLDTDGDGLPDWWERRYFGGPTNAQPHAHSDADESADGDEYRAGTDPWSAASCLRVAGVGDDGGALRLEWAAAPRRRYRVDMATNLLIGDFMPLVTAIPATPPSNVFTDVTGVGPAGVFRIGVE